MSISKQLTVGGILILIFSFFYKNIIWVFFFGLLMIFCGFIGPLIIILIYIGLSPKHQTGSGATKTTVELDAFNTILVKRYESEISFGLYPSKYPVIFSRLVDGALQNLLHLTFRDFVAKWLTESSLYANKMIHHMKEDVWGAIQSFHDRLSRIDHTKLVACDIINQITLHFEKIRIAQEAATKNKDPVFILSPQLISKLAELNYLRQISELCIIFFFPRSYSLSPAKYLLREIIIHKIFMPAIDLITNPDYINQKILLYIKHQQFAEAMHRKTYEYAKSFEDFIRMIKDSQDLDVLKHIRHNIITEIMQATTIQNIKRAQGLDSENSSFNKSDMIQAKKLKKYISQLTYAKNICECHIQSLGEYCYPIQDNSKNESVLSERQILPLQIILCSAVGRKYFSQFLEQAASQGLLGYWAAVQELRNANKLNWHQLGAEIFYTYIRSPTAEIKVDKNTKKRMEAFLLGDKGPNVFYEVQEDVVKILQDKYYSSFIVSDQYKKMAENFSNENVDRLVENQQINDKTTDNKSLMVTEHSNYARGKLDQLQEKLNNKVQALQALKSSLKPESKVLDILAKEVEWLHGEKRQLEAHLTHTEMWAEHLGKWRTDVQSAEIPENGDSPHFTLVVHMAEEEDNSDSISTGWVVFRKLPEFQDFHQKLCQLCPDVKHLELPSQPLKFFGKTDKPTPDKAKVQVQKYLNFILADDKLNQSEALYAFLSPSSEHLKHIAIPLPKKSRFSLSTLFKTNSGGSEDTKYKHDIDYSLLLNDSDCGQPIFDGYLNHGKDIIAEPLYALIGEVFDLHGVFRWLRRSLITFVQITYGRTINRQVRETVTWIFSEPMLYYYIQLFTKSWWPNGETVPNSLIRTDEEKLKTRGEARRQLLNNLPEVLLSLVGTQSAHRGVTKVFDTLQDVKLNRQLFYDILEVLLHEIFPELQCK